MPKRLVALIPIALLLSISAGASPEADSTRPIGSASITDEVRVSEVGIVAEAETSKPEQIEVIEGGEIRQVRRIAPIGDWQVLIYVDIPLSDHSTVVAGTEALANVAESLTRLGDVRLVVADALPRDRLPATRDAYDLREALLRVGREPMGAHRLFEIRDAFARALRGSADEVEKIAERSLEAELETVRVQLERLLGVGADACVSNPCLLFLVTDGFDEDPRAFYEGMLAESSLDTQTEATGLTDRLGPLLSANRWVVFPLPIRPGKAKAEGSEAERKPRSLFLRPDENEAMVSFRRGTPASTFDALEVLLLPMSAPLLSLAKASGGSVIRSPSQLDTRLRRLGKLRRVWFSTSMFDGNTPLAVEVRRKKDGKVLRSQKWVGSNVSEEVQRARLRGVLEGWRSVGDVWPDLEVIDRKAEGDQVRLQLRLDLGEDSIDLEWGFLGEEGRVERLEVTEHEGSFVAAVPKGAQSLAVVGSQAGNGIFGTAFLDLGDEESERGKK